MKLPREDFDDSRARRLYGDQYGDDEAYFYGPGDYQPIIDELGDPVVQVDDDDYQGDTRILYRKDGRYGLLNFGWGSCSGCDGLRACTSFREIEELIQGLEDGIVWFDSLEAAKDYVCNDKDRIASYYWHQEEWKEFKQKVMEYQPSESP